MFKPLLRTLPSLSGNFTIGCKLNEIKKINNNEYYTYVRLASLMPLQNILYNGDIKLNLLNDRYDHDIKKFYNIYSNYFYKENYQYDKTNYKKLDLYSFYNNLNDSRNKDYEFGCKRINYSQNGYQFSFYAPIYIDNIDDLPECFQIKLQFNDHYEKTINIYINKDNNRNYLGKYIKSYLKNIDDKVIFLLPDSAQATYFGIDVKNGGLSKYKDNVIGNIFINQTTINNFDNTICQGFERNNLIMRQIIPLSFVFNVNDLFNEYEKQFFNGYQIKVTGYYCSKNKVYSDFYDFSIDYNHFYGKYNKYNKNSGLYSISYGENSNNEIINIMNVGFPSLNEAKYVKYLYTNKLTPKYCRFKMLLSDDNDPYITNINFGYSYLQNPIHKYGYFPTMFKGIYPKAIVKNNDFKLPIGLDINSYYKIVSKFGNNVYTDSSNFDKYVKLMSNYYSSWFNVKNIDSEEDINSIIKNNHLWSDVKHNYSYFKGVLYNLINVNKYNLDKFGIFLSYKLKNYTKDELYNSIIKAKYIFSSSDKSNVKINEFNDSYDMSQSFTYKYIDESNKENTYTINLYNKLINYAGNNKGRYLLYDKVMKKDKTGKYIKENTYYEENIYYRLSDIINVILRFSSVDTNDDEIQKLINDISSHKIIGYLLLDAFNNENFFDNEKVFMLTNELFKDKDKSNNEIGSLYNKLYYTNEYSKEKYLLADSYTKIQYNKDTFGKFCVFFKDEYVHYHDIMESLNNIIHETNSSLLFNNLNKINSNILSSKKYIFEYIGSPNGVTIENYFIKYENFESTPIYVDSLNLVNLIEKYNSNADIKITLNSNLKKSAYIKFLDRNHIKEYYNKTCRDEYNIAPGFIFTDNILKHLYVKKRNWIISENYIDIKDEYSTLYEYIMNYKIQTIDNYEILISDLLENISTYSDIYKQDSQLVYWINFAIELSDVLDDNYKLINWLYNIISIDKTNNGKFKIIVGSESIEFDLYFYKEVYKLDYSLNKLMVNNKKIVNYLYLYINDSQKESNIDTWNVITNMTSTVKNYIDINECLTPLFTNIYVNENDVNNIEIMINNNKIYNYSYVNNIGSYFKEIDVLETIKYKCTYNDANIIKELNNIFNNSEGNQQLYNTWLSYIEVNNIKVYNLTDEEKVLLNIEKINFLKNNDEYIDKYYDVVSSSLDLYSIEDTLDISLYNESIINNIDNLEYDENTNIYIYNSNDKKYGFYLININIDNTNNSFYIKDDYSFNINFNYINGHEILSDESKKYINSIFYLLVPFLRINIFDEFVKNTNCVVLPYESELTIKYSNIKLEKENEYKYSIMQDFTNDTLYKDLTKLLDQKNIKLLRYFNYITPLLQKTVTLENYWEHKFINDDNITYNIPKNNIFIKSDINIYKYHPIKLYKNVYSDVKETMQIEDVYQIEYKHFNDNLIYNLPETIEYIDNNEYNENEISDIINNPIKINNIKKQILSNYFKKNHLDYDNILLFLFNKYDTDFSVDKIYSKLNNYKDIKFKISYKFKLI